ncbi:hypothetical protein GGP73_003131 [Salinibacter ruber]|nr:hypothetical protein [Salinibacter ruber]
MARFLLISYHQVPALLEVADTALDCISVVIFLFAQSWWATGSLSDVSPNRNGRLDPFVRAPLPDPVGIVCPIHLGRFGTLPWSASGPRDRYLLHQIDEEGRLVALTG